jgi:co-chaperonin GroES (HSP10)
MVAKNDPEVQMLWDWCLLEVLPSGQTKGGIHLPETLGETDTEPPLARVVAVGPGCPDSNGNIVDHGVRAGDMAYAMHRGGFNVWLEGTKYLVLQAQSLIMRLPRKQEN